MLDESPAVEEMGDRCMVNMDTSQWLQSADKPFESLTGFLMGEFTMRVSQMPCHHDCRIQQYGGWLEMQSHTSPESTLRNR